MAASKRRSSPLQISKDQPTNNVHSLKLVKDHVSQDTIEALEYLLYGARRGEVIGLAYAAMLKHESCLTDITGEAYHNPILALGVVSMLSNDIAHRARNEDE